MRVGLWRQRATRVGGDGGLVIVAQRDALSERSELHLPTGPRRRAVGCRAREPGSTVSAVGRERAARGRRRGRGACILPSCVDWRRQKPSTSSTKTVTPPHTRAAMAPPDSEGGGADGGGDGGGGLGGGAGSAWRTRSRGKGGPVYSPSRLVRVRDVLLDDSSRCTLGVLGVRGAFAACAYWLKCLTTSPWTGLRRG